MRIPAEASIPSTAGFITGVPFFSRKNFENIAIAVANIAAAGEFE